MFIIYGTRNNVSVRETGEFYCKYCDGDEDYRLIEERTWFTLFFLPVFPVSGRRQYVECRGCGDHFKPHVLDNRPPADDDDKVDRVYAELEKGLSLERATDELIKSGARPGEARQLVRDAAGRRTNHCKTCAATYLESIRRCPGCGGDFRNP